MCPVNARSLAPFRNEEANRDVDAAMRESATSALLCYVDDSLPGITRKPLKRGWAYWDAKGERITDRDEIDRLNAIGMPPAYVDCWFCPSMQGHIQGTGYDARGRKQYRYHPDFRAGQDADKYGRCAAFGRALPLLRARVESDLQGTALQRDTVVAAVIRLLDLGRVRVGNESYAKANKSYGATTLRRRHAQLSSGRIKLQFRAKSGKMQQLTIADRRLVRLARRCQDLPGQHLFQYVDAEGAAHPVGSADVNAYLRETMGEAFSAKHFRTWGASVIAFEALVAAGGKLPLKALLAPVCEALGNTPAIARKSYVHPALIEAAQNSGLSGGLKLPRRTKYLSAIERGLIEFLETAVPSERAEAA
jgi:DNA topoisomerase-1